MRTWAMKSHYTIKRREVPGELMNGGNVFMTDDKFFLY